MPSKEQIIWEARLNALTHHGMLMPQVPSPYLKFEMTLIGSRDIIDCIGEVDGKNMFDIMLSNAGSMFTIVRQHALRIIRTGTGMPPNVGKYAMEKRFGNEYMAVFQPDRDFLFGARNGFLSDIRVQYQLPYRQQTRSRYDSFADSTARYHALGRLSGDLYEGVRSQKPTIQYKEPEIRIGPRGGEKLIYKNVDIKTVTTFSNPPYIGYVHDGKPGVVARPFMELAARQSWRKIQAHIDKKFRKVNLHTPGGLSTAFVIDPSDREVSIIEAEVTYSKRRTKKRKTKAEKAKKEYKTPWARWREESYQSSQRQGYGYD